MLRTRRAAPAQYEGNWANDKRHGFGTYTLANGKVRHKGEWENEQPKK